MVNRVGIDLRLTKHMYLTPGKSDRETRNNRKGIFHELKLAQSNDTTFTTAGEILDLLVDPAGQKPNILNRDLVK